jgi:hypothetical protein
MSRKRASESEDSEVADLTQKSQKVGEVGKTLDIPKLAMSATGRISRSPSPARMAAGRSEIQWWWWW